MSGKQLRLLRSLARSGPLYEPAAALVVGATEHHLRRLANDAIRRGWITRDANLTLTITDEGRELVAAMTP